MEANPTGRSWRRNVLGHDLIFFASTVAAATGALYLGLMGIAQERRAAHGNRTANQKS